MLMKIRNINEKSLWPILECVRSCNQICLSLTQGKLRARQKQLDIGKNTLGFKKLIEQKLTGSQLQDIIRYVL